ncbi:hypothetical protein CQW23_26617 [Capsicum baccatum]|uniref:Uncharacterized protein n=1 Tax=Capsicum baccatum TaxID=33114 RepID=A0A2G2VPB0_CAPBA|nr:hypothetical protein CQW23_26617 [Capsicum baccatum]
MELEPNDKQKLEEIMSSWENSVKSSPMHDFAPVDFDSVLQPLTVSSSMADQENPLTTMKKTLFYKFYPSGDEEEACKAKNVPWLVRRELIEIRDTYPVPIIDLENPWKFKKKIDEYDFTQTGLLIPFLVAFEHIIRYWKLPDGKTLVNGNWWNVVLCDVTEENDLKKYDGASGRSFRFGKMWDDDYFLQCRQLFIDRGLGVGDEIGLYWDPWETKQHPVRAEAIHQWSSQPELQKYRKSEAFKFNKFWKNVSAQDLLAPFLARLLDKLLKLLQYTQLLEVDNVVVACFFELQVIMPEPRVKTFAETLRLSSNELS